MAGLKSHDLTNPNEQRGRVDLLKRPWTFTTRGGIREQLYYSISVERVQGCFHSLLKSSQ